MKITPISVSYVDHMGSDLSVVNAARVSFDKESGWEWEEVAGQDEQGRFTELTPRLSERDRSLIGYLAKHNHWSPFAHTSLQLRIKAPIFVARQLVKHQVGLVWNEVSRRYVDSEPEFYFPDVWRGKPVNAKQGSDGIVTGRDLGNGVGWEPHRELTNAVESSLEAYNALLEEGVAPEMARMVLPQNTMTEWIWSGSLYAFARVCKLRLDSHAQEETRQVAVQINDIAKQYFPVSWEALMNKGTNGSN